LPGSSRDGELQVEFEYTGLRPGEKLEEELCIEPSGESPTGFDSIMVEGYRSGLKWDELQAGLDVLVLAARNGRVNETLKALADLVPEYRPVSQRYVETLG
jgi:FlaA1/EpsC-like NDP-sugar epimerase